MEKIKLLQRANRSRQIDTIFRKCPPKAFNKGLELGAGDGFQSALIANYVNHLTCTELNEERLSPNSNLLNVHYMIMDAETVKEKFPVQSFDLVFSSNLMEHLPNVEICFTGIHRVLQDQGIVIHSMPTTWWRFFTSLFHYPALFISLLNRLGKNNSKRAVNPKGNNLKQNRSTLSLWKKVLIPKPHGVSSNIFSEHFAFKKKKWVNLFDKTGFEIIRIKNGPVSAGGGYQLGFQKLAPILEKWGIATEYIYIAKKKDSESTYTNYFR